MSDDKSTLNPMNNIVGKSATAPKKVARHEKSAAGALLKPSTAPSRRERVDISQRNEEVPEEDDHGRKTAFDEVYDDVVPNYYANPTQDELPWCLRTESESEGTCAATLASMDQRLQKFCQGIGIVGWFTIVIRLYDFVTDIAMAVDLVVQSRERPSELANTIAAISSASIIFALSYNAIALALFVMHATGESREAHEIISSRSRALVLVLISSLLDLDTIEVLIPIVIAPVALNTLRRRSIFGVLVHSIPHVVIQVVLASQTSSFNVTLILSAVGTLLSALLEFGSWMAVLSVSERVSDGDLRELASETSSLPTWACARGACFHWRWAKWVTVSLYFVGLVWITVSLVGLVFGPVQTALDPNAEPWNPTSILAAVVGLLIVFLIIITRTILIGVILARGRSFPRKAALELVRVRRISGAMLLLSSMSRVTCIQTMGVFSKRGHREIEASAAAWDLILFLPLAIAFGISLVFTEASIQPALGVAPFSCCVVLLLHSAVRFLIAAVSSAGFLLHRSTPEDGQPQPQTTSPSPIPTPSQPQNHHPSPRLPPSSSSQQPPASLSLSSVLGRALLMGETNMRLCRALDSTEGGSLVVANPAIPTTVAEQEDEEEGEQMEVVPYDQTPPQTGPSSNLCAECFKEMREDFRNRTLCCGLTMLFRPHGHSEMERLRWTNRALFSVCSGLCARVVGPLLLTLSLLMMLPAATQTETAQIEVLSVATAWTCPIQCSSSFGFGILPWTTLWQFDTTPDRGCTESTLGGQCSYFLGIWASENDRSWNAKNRPTFADFSNDVSWVNTSRGTALMTLADSAFVITEATGGTFQFPETISFDHAFEALGSMQTSIFAASSLALAAFAVVTCSNIVALILFYSSTTDTVTDTLLVRRNTASRRTSLFDRQVSFRERGRTKGVCWRVAPDLSPRKFTRSVSTHVAFALACGLFLIASIIVNANARNTYLVAAYLRRLNRDRVSELLSADMHVAPPYLLVAGLFVLSLAFFVLSIRRTCTSRRDAIINTISILIIVSFLVIFFLALGSLHVSPTQSRLLGSSALLSVGCVLLFLLIFFASAANGSIRPDLRDLSIFVPHLTVRQHWLLVLAVFYLLPFSVTFFVSHGALFGFGRLVLLSLGGVIPSIGLLVFLATGAQDLTRAMLSPEIYDETPVIFSSEESVDSPELAPAKTTIEHEHKPIEYERRQSVADPGQTDVA